MSKPILYLFNGKVARFGNAVFGFTPAEVYTVTLDTVTHGSISASPMSGSEGTTIELSSTPDTGYQLGSYSVDGSAILGSSFSMPSHNVVVGATFSAIAYTITIGTSVNGTVTASAQTATYGTTITLASTPASGYELDYFTVDGVEIVGDTFTMPAANVTVGAVFKEIPATAIETLLFSSSAGASSGELSDEITNYDEIWIMHGLYDQYTITTLTNDYSSGFCLINSVAIPETTTFLSYYMYSVFSDSTHFAVNDDGQWKTQTFGSGGYGNATSYKTQNLVHKIWGVKYE